MKRIAFRPVKLLFLLLIVLGLAITAGCGAGKENSAGSQGGDNEQTQEQAQAQDQGNGSDQANGSDQTPAGLTSFQTKDIYGNDVNQDIFLDYSLTLVNVWGTFCGPCLEEMPYLGELQKEYEPKGVNIVGIVIDVQDEDMQIIDDQIKLARDIADRTGANYTHMIVSTDMIDVLNRFDAIPASFFVDSSGKIVSEFNIGSRSKKDWVDLIETNIQNQ